MNYSNKFPPRLRAFIATTNHSQSCCSTAYNSTGADRKDSLLESTLLVLMVSHLGFELLSEAGIRVSRPVSLAPQSSFALKERPGNGTVRRNDEALPSKLDAQPPK
ncbi:hypothetical protein H0G86_001910 [Trichoderma simmonsii]|uniref:Uncharacterized protein n=1 Tax=Trichoderma simmonsii TaxID=1491479 RepID=A0A8G0L2H4_9HYPO|nr:hypothetical protein H0G86_001910 [Trichoderma simmonsii]